jgi:hypothetical protein
MQTLSNNEDFVKAIQDIKKKARKLKTPRGQTPYRYIIATEQNKVQFLRNMKLFEEAQAAKEEELKQMEQEQKELEREEELNTEEPDLEKEGEGENIEENEQINEEEGLNEEES